MRKLFGTDGIRAVAGEAPLDSRTIRAVGKALAYRLHQATKSEPGGRPSPAGKPAREDAAANTNRVRVLMGMDTRESGPWIAAELAAGLRAGGAEVDSAGVITTPAVAFLARRHRFSAGVVISASHNPWRDNGIKVFGGDGYKLPDAVELDIETEIGRILAEAPQPGERAGRARAAAAGERKLSGGVCPLSAGGGSGDLARQSLRGH